MMKCIVCHSDDIQTREVYEELKVGQDIVYVPIHVLVCQSCGERYYSRQTMHFLEEVEQELQKKREGKLELQELGKVLLYR